MSVTEIEIDHSVETDKDKTSDLTIGDNQKTDAYNVDMTVGEELIDIKIIIIEMTVEIERQNFWRNFSNDNRDRSRTRERSLTPRRNGNRKYDSPNVNLGTINRSNSRVTTNRDRIRCFRCREYDHFANECPNAVTDDSDGYESDRAASQLRTTQAEIHDNFDTTRLNEEKDYLNL